MKKVAGKKNLSINAWPEQDRPREKLLHNGEAALSDSELLEILLRTGVRGQSALDLAREVLKKFGTFRNMSHVHISEWKDIKGLGVAKVSQIKAAIEVGRRFAEDATKDNKPAIESPQDVVAILMPQMRDLKKEVVKVVLLNSRNRIVDIVDVTEGTVNYAAPVVRDIFLIALQNFAASLICVHNHPSGDPAPSEKDRQFTKELSQGGEILGIAVLDHVIIGDNTYYSFLDQGDEKG